MSAHASHLWESSDGVRGQSYLSVLRSLPSAVLKNPTAFWSGCQGRRDRHPFGCYSKFQSELGVLAFLGQYFPRAYLTRFLTFWWYFTHGTMSHWRPWQSSPFKSKGCFYFISAGTLPLPRASLWIISPFFPTVATPPNIYWQVGFTPTTPSLRRMVNKVEQTLISVRSPAFTINYRHLFPPTFSF